eukprot:6541744-Prorocentrum_lima.AAC.1
MEMMTKKIELFENAYDVASNKEYYIEGQFDHQKAYDDIHSHVDRMKMEHTEQVNQNNIMGMATRIAQQM